MTDNKKQLPEGITLRKDGRYQARYTFKGKRYTIYGKTLKEVQKKLRDAKYEMDHGIFAKPDKLTVESWFKVWMEEYQSNLIRENTKALYHSMYNHHIKNIIGKMKLNEVRAEHIQIIINKLQNKKYSISFIKRVKNVLNIMFKQAYKNDLIMRNPVSASTVPTENKQKQKRALSVREQEIFLRYSRETEYEDLFYIGFFTGMRIGEILALQWKNIDFKKSEIQVEGTLIKVDGKEYRKGPTKTQSSQRTIPMLQEVTERLRKLRKKQMEQRLIIGEMWTPVPDLNDLVFTTSFGRPIARSVIFQKIDKIIEVINHDERIKAREENNEPIIFEHFSTHTMRHTFATRALENGIPPKVLQELLGHSTIKTTMDIYAHVFPETKAEEIKKIANIF